VSNRRQPHAAGDAGVQQALHGARDARCLVANALEVADGLRHGDQQTQIAGGGLPARNDGREVTVDLHFQGIDALLLLEHQRGDVAAED